MPHRFRPVLLSSALALSFAGMLVPSVARASVGPIVTVGISQSIVQSTNGDGKAEPGDTINYTATIQNAAAVGNDASGVTFTDTPDPNTTLNTSSLHVGPIAFPDFYTALGNVPLSPTTSVLANDAELDSDSLSAVANNAIATSAGGTASLNANGTFTYVPPAGFRTTNCTQPLSPGNDCDTFQYTVQDTHGVTATGTVYLAVPNVVWFVNNAAGGANDGRLNSPFTSLAAFNTQNGSGHTLTHPPQASDAVFLYSGSGAYSGSVTLQQGQKLIGQGASSSLASILGVTDPTISAELPSTGGTGPTISNSGNGVTLNSGNLVQGVTLSNTGGTALIGSNVGTLTVKDTAVSNSGGTAVNLANGTLNATFKSVSAGGGAAMSVPGISVSNTAGSFTVTGNGSTASGGDASGGTIQNINGTSTNGANFDNAGTVSLTNMKFLTIGQFGVNADAGDSGHTSGATTITVNYSQFNDTRSTAFNAQNFNGGQLSASLNGSTLTDDNQVGQNASYNDNVNISGGDTSTTTFNVTNNTITKAGLTAVNLDLAGGSSGQTATLQGTVSNNTIGISSVSNSGSEQAYAIWADANGAPGGGGHLTALLTGNHIYNTHDSGILVSSGDGAPKADVTVTNNQITQDSNSQEFAGIFAYSGKAPGDTDTMCADLNNNTIHDGSSQGSASIFVAQGYDDTGIMDIFKLGGYSGIGTVDNFLNSRNTLDLGSADDFNQGFSPASSCSQPSSSPAYQTHLRQRERVHLLPVAAPGTPAGTGSQRQTRASFNGSNAFSIGTLPAGTTVKLTFSATVKDPLSTPATSATNNVSVSGSNFTTKTNSAQTSLNLFNSQVTQVSSSSGGTSVYSQPVTFTATVQKSTGTGTPLGTVSFYDGTPGANNKLGSDAQLSDQGNGTSTATSDAVSVLTVAGHTIYAVYNGDGVTFNGSQNSTAQTVNQAGTTTTITSVDPEPSGLGQSATVYYTVSGNAPASGAPTDSQAVTITDDAGPATCTGDVSSGSGSCQLTFANAAGNHGLTAAFSGDTGFTSSSSTPAYAHGVSADTPSVAVDSSTGNSASVFGQSVTFTATIAPSVNTITAAPGGSVTFTAENTTTTAVTTLCSNQAISGSPPYQATCDFSALPPGNYTITASYSGDQTNFNVNSGTVAQTVNQADTATSVTASPSSVSYGRAVVYTASVAPLSPGACVNGTCLTGTVDFVATNTGTTTSTTICAGRPIASGQAVCNYSSLPAGNYSVKAVYNAGGDPNFNSSVDANETAGAETVNPDTNVGDSLTGTSDGTSATATVPTGANTGDSGSYSATASPGTANVDWVTVLSYLSDPGTPVLPRGTGFFDVRLPASNTFTAVNIVDCQEGSARPVAIYWYNGAAWTPVVATLDTTTYANCVAFTLTDSTVPSVSQLSGTPFGTAKSVTYIPVRGLTAHRQGNRLTVRWQLAARTGVAGFNVFAGPRRLNARVIPLHRSAQYAFHTRWSGRGPYVLRVLMTDGTTREVRAGG